MELKMLDNLACALFQFCLLLLLAAPVSAQEGSVSKSYERFKVLSAGSESDSRDPSWKPGEGLALEVSGMEWVNDRLAVCIRKGEVWMIDNPLSEDRSKIKFNLFASGLHEPLGLLKDGNDILVTQRSEVTRLRDADKDGKADTFRTECDGWNVSGNYHAYAYGPARDGQGDIWVALNLDIGKGSKNNIGWRGWAGTIGKKNGSFEPKSLGMRSPCGMGVNLEGDMFFSDQQGTWIPATPIYHLRPGVFYGNQESAGTLKSPDAPFKMNMPKANQPYPAALASSERFVPPAVWLPYNKMGRSATDVQVINQKGKFGPFDGQLLVGEFTNSAINRVFLEKIDGQYQGACFPFLSGFPAAVLRLQFTPDGSLFVGMSNRGWSSLGNRSYGLERIRFNQHTPFAIKEMRAKPDGFELTFTEPVQPESISSSSLEMSSFTYQYSSKYGGDEINAKTHKLSDIKLSKDGLSVRYKVTGLRENHVVELRTKGLKSKSGQTLKYPDAWYTLNRIPKK